MRVRGETVVFPTGAAVVVQRVLGNGVHEVMVLQDPAGDYAVGSVWRWSEWTLQSGMPGHVVERPEPVGVRG